MAKFKEIIGDPTKRSAVIADCERVLDEEVARKSGVSGLVVKAGFATVKAVKPGIIREAIDGLLDEFAEKLDPFYQEYVDAGARGGFEPFLRGQAGRVADALLSVTDVRALRAKQQVLRKVYEKLRPAAHKNVVEGVPGVARIVEKHLKAAGSVSA